MRQEGFEPSVSCLEDRCTGPLCDYRVKVFIRKLVGRVGLEPTRISAHASETCMATTYKHRPEIVRIPFWHQQAACRSIFESVRRDEADRAMSFSVKFVRLFVGRREPFPKSDGHIREDGGPART